MNVASHPSVAAMQGSPLDPFAIAATSSLQERRPRTLKHGDTFAMLDGCGNIPPGIGQPEGLYHRDTRYLSRFELLIAGTRPMLLSSTMRHDNATLTCDLTNADIEGPAELLLEHDLIHIRRTTFLFEGVFHERIAVRNYASERHELTLDLRFGADFSDLFEVRGQTRLLRGQAHAPVLGDSRVVLSYTGLDRRHRSTTLRFDPAPAVLEPHRALFTLALPPGGRSILHTEIACDRQDISRPPLQTFYVGLRDARRALRASAGRAASVASDNEVFNEAARRSIADIYMLVTQTEHGPYPYAGTPWYSTAFGRDGLITALMMLWLDPTIARGVLCYLAANQATAVDPVADAEPGKILHEVRYGEMAECGEVPFRRYYGSVDATPLFVMLAGAYFARTGDVTTIRELWPNIRAALQWIDVYGDRDGDGFVEYFRKTDSGLANQGWKDSYDAIFHADGRAAVAPIALCEVQGYVYAARVAGAEIARALGEHDHAAALDRQATAIRAAIEETFWSDRIGMYALALDGDKQPCLVRTSNAGHLLLAGVPTEGRARTVAQRLLDSSFFSGWGIRTVASGEARYNPMSYHNGSVWPHDNAMVAIGFARYGLRREAARVLEGMFAASAPIDLRRLPELLCGFARRPGQGPTFYPVACAPQAWAAATPLSLLQSCLGIRFDLARRTVVFEAPVLPNFLNRVILRGLAIADTRIDVALHRSDEGVAMSVLSRHGDIHASLIE